MEIPSTSSVSAAQTGQQTNIAIIKKTQDIMKGQGEAVLELLESVADVTAQSAEMLDDAGHLDITI